MGKRDDGAGAVVVVVFILVAGIAIVIPKPIWVTFAIVLGIAAVAVVGTLVRKDVVQQRQIRAAIDRATEEEQAQVERARVSNRLGHKNIGRLDTVQAAAEQGSGSDAASEG